jgi:hypothetical protein
MNCGNPKAGGCGRNGHCSRAACRASRHWTALVRTRPAAGGKTACDPIRPLIGGPDDRLGWSVLPGHSGRDNDLCATADSALMDWQLWLTIA